MPHCVPNQIGTGTSTIRTCLTLHSCFFLALPTAVLPKLADAQLARAKAAGFNLSPKQLEELVAAGTGEALGKAPFAGVSGIAESLQSDVAQGIPGDDVDVLKRTQIYGTNAIPEKPPKPFLEFVWDAMQVRLHCIVLHCTFALYCCCTSMGLGPLPSLRSPPKAFLEFMWDAMRVRLYCTVLLPVSPVPSAQLVHDSILWICQPMPLRDCCC